MKIQGDTEIRLNYERSCANAARAGGPIAMKRGLSRTDETETTMEAAIKGAVATLRRFPKANVNGVIVFHAFRNRCSTPAQCEAIEVAVRTALEVR